MLKQTIFKKLGKLDKQLTNTISDVRAYRKGSKAFKEASDNYHLISEKIELLTSILDECDLLDEAVEATN